MRKRVWAYFFMEERTRYINGRLFINSSKEGTRVTVNIPI